MAVIAAILRYNTASRRVAQSAGVCGLRSAKLKGVIVAACHDRSTVAARSTFTDFMQSAAMIVMER